MKIPVDRLTATPQRFDFRGDSGWWCGAIRPAKGLPRELDEPIRFAIDARCIAENLFFEGSAEGALELECARCLARYRHSLRERFRLVLEPSGNRLPADPEGAAALVRSGMCLGDELESGWFRGSEINLEAFFVELVSLALPVKPLCRTDCAGLCPRCGAERSAGGCECSNANSSSPFSVLASLRGELTGGDT